MTPAFIEAWERRALPSLTRKGLFAEDSPVAIAGAVATSLRMGRMGRTGQHQEMLQRSSEL